MSKPTQYEIDSYEWRKNSESKDPNYCGSCSLEVHVKQVRHPDSWVSEDALNRWKAEWEKDNAPTEVELLKQTLQQVREISKLELTGKIVSSDAVERIAALIGDSDE